MLVVVLLAARAAEFLEPSANALPLDGAPQELADFVRDEDDGGDIEREEPELPRDRASAEEVVDARNVDDEECASKRDGNGEDEEKVLLGAEEHGSAEDGGALFFRTEQISELSEDESDEEDALANLKMVVEFLTCVEAALGVRVRGDSGSDVVLFVREPELVHADSSVVLVVIEEQDECAKRFKDTNLTIRLSVDPTIEEMCLLRTRLALHHV